MRKRNYINLNLNDCKKLYEDFFGRSLPGDLPYFTAAEMVRDAVGFEAFRKMVKKIQKDDNRSDWN